jgi:hypothetical protein
MRATKNKFKLDPRHSIHASVSFDENDQLNSAAEKLVAKLPRSWCDRCHQSQQEPRLPSEKF